MSYVKNFLKMDKIERLFDAVEHPERYSEAEIDTLLQDPEVKEVFDLLDKTKSSLHPVSSPDIDAEWAAFRLHHRAAAPSLPLRLLTLFSRNIAASIAIVLASCAAVAAIVGVSVSYSFRNDTSGIEPQQQVAPAAINTIPDSVAVTDIPAPAAEVIVFDNEPFDTIITRIATEYGYSVTFTSDDSKALRLYFRWNKAMTVEEVVESLNNFEQLHLTIDDQTITID